MMFNFLKKKDTISDNVFIVISIKRTGDINILGYTPSEDFAKQKVEEFKSLIVNDLKCTQCIAGNLKSDIRDGEKHIAAVNRVRTLINTEIKENPDMYKCADIKVKVKEYNDKRFVCAECKNKEYNPDDIVGITYLKASRL